MPKWAAGRLRKLLQYDVTLALDSSRRNGPSCSLFTVRPMLWTIVRRHPIRYSVEILSLLWLPFHPGGFENLGIAGGSYLLRVVHCWLRLVYCRLRLEFRVIVVGSPNVPKGPMCAMGPWAQLAQGPNRWAERIGGTDRRD